MLPTITNRFDSDEVTFEEQLESDISSSFLLRLSATVGTVLSVFDVLSSGCFFITSLLHSGSVSVLVSVLSGVDDVLAVESKFCDLRCSDSESLISLLLLFRFLDGVFMLGSKKQCRRFRNVTMNLSYSPVYARKNSESWQFYQTAPICDCSRNGNPDIKS